MLVNYVLSHEAENDILEGYFWYEQQNVGLGEEFLESLDKAHVVISKNPESYQIRYQKRVRAFPVTRFPYLILYILSKNDVYVISVFNTNRNPKEWKKRVRNL